MTKCRIKYKVAICARTKYIINKSFIFYEQLCDYLCRMAAGNVIHKVNFALKTLCRCFGFSKTRQDTQVQYKLSKNLPNHELRFISDQSVLSVD